MSTILISGASSGLGLAFVNAYGSDVSNKIIAIDRAPFTSPSKVKATIQFHLIDVSSPSSVAELGRILKDVPIDLVIHSAGIRGLVPSAEDAQPDNVAAAETLQAMDFETMTRTFAINSAGTFVLLRTLLPNLLLAAERHRSPYGMSSSVPKVIVMSSRMGSIGHNTIGGGYAYRASKVALNAIVRSMSVDVPEVAFVLCHPGRVETKLVKCKEEGAIPAQESVEGLLPLIDRWGAEDSGRFFDRFGGPIQW
ncbi:hypothetical protein LTR50_002724 [Elasticomyces elasticus]|nr:hypothetical protein LTR50_002724 [Elasticomyces elasticus]